MTPADESPADESPDAAALAGATPARLGRHDQTVLECLRARQTHPTAAELYAAVRQHHPRIGQATVYRALARLVSAGLVAEVGRDALGRHYDARTDRHDHAVCVACGRVLDLPIASETLPPTTFAALAEAAHWAGLDATTYEIRLYGRCAECAREGAGV